MTVTTSPDRLSVQEPSAVPTAAQQTPLEPEKLLHSTNSGMIIHRVGQLEYEFAKEGREFSLALVKYMNPTQAGVATTFFYEELFGVRDRVHWLVHLRSANEYRKLLDMVDHDKKLRKITEGDRMPEKGGGNWERMFIYGSFQERILCPQHGVVPDEEETHDEALFVPPAGDQLKRVQPPELQLNSANAGAIIMRTSNVRYELREEARAFVYDWQLHVNEAMAGRMSATLYEETFGQQDRIYCLIHLRTLDDYKELSDLDKSEVVQRQFYGKQVVPAAKGGGTWDRMFAPASIHDTVLVPGTVDQS